MTSSEPGLVDVGCVQILVSIYGMGLLASETVLGYVSSVSIDMGYDTSERVAGTVGIAMKLIHTCLNFGDSSLQELCVEPRKRKYGLLRPCAGRGDGSEPAEHGG